MKLVAVVVVAACGRVGFDPVGGTAGDGALGDRPIIDSNIVFVTPPTLTPGTFGGLAAADAACQTFAAQAGLPGTYVAYLSSSTVNALDRLAGSRGWRRPDGTPFADMPIDIPNGRVMSTPIVEADGTRPATTNGPELVVTGTDATGTLSAGGSCNDYTSTTGVVMAGSATFAGFAFANLRSASACGSGQRIYCFGVGRDVPVAPPMPTAADRRAFVSTSGWTSGGGLASADAACQAEAAAAGLTGTYLAMLATSTASAASRFSTTGPPWMRVDGLRLADTAAELLGDTRFVKVPLNVTAKGSYLASGFVYTGANDVFSVGGNTCVDWVSSAPGQSGDCGWSDAADPTWFYNLTGTGPTTFSCSTSQFIYCFER